MREGEKVMILSVEINKKANEAFATDLESGNTWSKKNWNMSSVSLRKTMQFQNTEIPM